LSGVQIHLPPLRDRTDDIAPLCQHFLNAMNYRSKETAIDDKLLEQLCKRPWYGNVRELKYAIEHAAVVARGRPLSIEDFPAAKPSRGTKSNSPQQSLEQAVRAWACEVLENQTPLAEPLHSQFLAAAEPALLQVAMEFTGGNRAKAAELLGIHRGTLRDRLRAYSMDDAKGDA
jgi:two-component system, NtrC family, nitrogen regulation response regulator GlnG